MPIAEVKQIHDGRDFDETPDEITYTSVWMVRTTQRYDEGALIREAAQTHGLPYFGAKYRADSDALCNAINGVNTNGPYWWVITYGFSTEADPPDPLDDEIEYRWSDVFRSELSDIGVNEFTGAQLTMANSAEDPYDEPISVQTGLKEVTWTFNIDGDLVLPDWVFNLTSDKNLGRYMVNSDAIVIDKHKMERYTFRMQRVEVGEVLRRNKINYRRVVCRGGWNRSDWTIRRLDEGFYVRAANGKRIPILTDFSTLPSKPVPLDGEGNELLAHQRDRLVLNKHHIYANTDMTNVPGIELAPLP